jgi:hypothetical protein
LPPRGTISIAARIALVDMPVEHHCAAGRGQPSCFLLLVRERISKRCEVSGAVEAENAAQLR